MQLPWNLNDWTYETVLEAVQSRAFEPGYLDFKAVLTPTRGAGEGFNESVRRTACSMANTDGGYILFGVEDAQKGTATPAERIKGIPLGGDLRKEFGEKLTPIQPQLFFEALPKPIPLLGDCRRGVFVVRIPQSIYRPHMVHPPGIFYRRGPGGHAVVMDYYEVRDLMVMRRQRLLTILKWEAEGNIASLCGKMKGLPFPYSWYMDQTRGEVTLALGDLDRPICLTREQTSRAVSFLVVLPGAARIRTEAAQEAVLSGEFLVVSQDTGSLAGDQTQAALQALLDTTNSYQQLWKSFEERRPHVLTDLSIALKSGQDHAEISGHNLATLFRLRDLLVDLLRLSVALLRHALDPTSVLRMPPLGPSSPLEETARALVEQEPTREDVERWVADGYLWALITGEQHLAGTEDMQAAFERYPALFEPIRERLEPYLEEVVRRARIEGLDAAIAWLQRALRDSG